MESPWCSPVTSPFLHGLVAFALSALEEWPVNSFQNWSQNWFMCTVASGEKPSPLPPLPRQPAPASQRLHVPGSLSRGYRRHWEVCSNYTNGGMWTSIKTHFFTFYSMLETIAVQALSSKVWSDRHGRQLLLWHCLRGALLRQELSLAFLTQCWEKIFCIEFCWKIFLFNSQPLAAAMSSFASLLACSIWRSAGRFVWGSPDVINVIFGSNASNASNLLCWWSSSISRPSPSSSPLNPQPCKFASGILLHTWPTKKYYWFNGLAFILHVPWQRSPSGEVSRWPC